MLGSPGNAFCNTFQMNILITGGSGFLGARLATALLEAGALSVGGGPARSISRLVLTDLNEPPVALQADSRVHFLKGSLQSVLRDGLPGPEVDLVFHLAAAVSAECEANFDLGMSSNLQATIDASLAAPVKFQTGSDRLTADGRQQLAPVIAAVKECQGTRLTVIGHTDNTGNDAINNPLSENRAQSVEDYLVAQGIPADSVTSQGAGSTEPMAGNDTDAGRAQNRRTEIMVG